MPPFRLSAGRDGVQPAAELRHVQRHEYGRHVPGALRACPIAPQPSQPGPLAVHAARALPPAHALPPPAHTSLRIVRPPFDSAGRVGVQPAAELRHLQRHGHGLHVLRALLPVPCPQSAVESLLHAACAAVVRRLPGRTSPRTVCPPFDSRQYASAFNQPLSFDTSSVTTMAYMFYVRSSPCPAPNLQSSPLPCTLRLHRDRTPPSCLPAHLAPQRMPSVRLSAVCEGVQPAAEPRHLQRHTHGSDV